MSENGNHRSSYVKKWLEPEILIVLGKAVVALIIAVALFAVWLWSHEWKIGNLEVNVEVISRTAKSISADTERIYREMLILEDRAQAARMAPWQSSLKESIRRSERFEDELLHHRPAVRGVAEED